MAETKVPTDLREVVEGRRIERAHGETTVAGDRLGPAMETLRFELDAGVTLVIRGQLTVEFEFSLGFDGDDEPEPVTRKCPDEGACHHECGKLYGGCWRVFNAAPLSGVFPDDKWPEEVTRSEFEKTRAHSVLDRLPTWEEVSEEMDALIERLAQLGHLQSAIFRNDAERAMALARKLSREKRDEANRTLAERISGG